MSISDDDINEQPADDGLPPKVAGDADGTDSADSDGTDGGDSDGTDGGDSDGPTRRLRRHRLLSVDAHWQVRRAPASGRALTSPISLAMSTRSAATVGLSASLVSRVVDLERFGGVDVLWDDLLRRGTRQPAFRVVRVGTTIAAGDVTRRAGLGGADLDDVVAPNNVVDRYRRGDTVVLQGLHHTNPHLARLANNLALAARPSRTGQRRTSRRRARAV